MGSATSSRGLFRAWRDRGAAAVILEDVAVMVGFGIGALDDVHRGGQQTASAGQR